MTWQHLVCALGGLLALLSQHWWERRRARARQRGEDYIRFDVPVAVTLATLIIPGILAYGYPQLSGLWTAWIGGALLVAVPTIIARLVRRRRRTPG